MFNRLTQLKKLLEAQKANAKYSKAYILILFWNTNKKRSSLFLLTLNEFLTLKKNIKRSYVYLDELKKFKKCITFNTIIEELRK